MNRSFAHLALLAIVLSATLAGCRGTGSGGALDTPPYNPYIEAFTSGRVSRGTTVHIIFSQAPDARRTTPEALSKAMSIRPSVSGRWEWQDERTAVFRPAGEFKRDTRYTVTADLGALFDAAGDDRRNRHPARRVCGNCEKHPPVRRRYASGGRHALRYGGNNDRSGREDNLSVRIFLGHG